MKMLITLADPEEYISAEVDARDRRAFELQGAKALGFPPGKLLDMAQTMPENYTYWVGWHAARRNGLKLTWDEFSERAVDLTEEKNDEEINPTKSGHSPD